MFDPIRPSQKFYPGARLWMIFFEPERELFKQINWRMGFLLHGLKGGKKLSQPILTGSQNAFPLSFLVCLPLKEKSWFMDAHNCWGRLGQPSLRIFLPLGLDEGRLRSVFSASRGRPRLSYYKEA